MSRISPIRVWCGLAGIVLFIHLALSFVSPNCYGLHVFGDMLQTLLLLCCYLFTLPNQVGRHRPIAFWTLLSVGFALWLLNQALWTYFEVVLETAPTPGFWGDVVLFLHTIPMMMAFAAGQRLTRATTIMAATIFIFWAYLYIAFVGSWQYISFDEGLYATNFNIVYGAANLALIVVAAARSWNAAGTWRTTCLHLLGAASVYAFASYLASCAIDRGAYYTGSVYDIPLVFSMFWFALAVLVGATAEQGAITSAPERSPVWAPALALLLVLGTGIAAALNPRLPGFVVHMRLLLAGTVSAGLALLALSFWLFDRALVRRSSAA